MSPGIGGGGSVQDSRVPVQHLGEEDDALDWVRTVDCGQRTEVGYRVWYCKESDMTEET